jgi:hypothetical protein
MAVTIKNKRLTIELSKNRSLFFSLLKPSGVSGLLVVMASLLIVIGVISVRDYGSSDLHQLLQTHGQSQPTVSSSYQTLSNHFSVSVVVSDIPLLIFWGGVGAVAYSFAVAVFKTVRNAIDFRLELDYVHANRRSLLRVAIERLILRAIVLGFWLLYMRYTAHVILPYAMAIIRAASSRTSWLLALGHWALAFGLLVACLHLHIILLRLVALRPRLFGWVYQT